MNQKHLPPIAEREKREKREKREIERQERASEMKRGINVDTVQEKMGE